MNLYTTTFTQNQKPVTCYFSVVKGFFCFLYCKIQVDERHKGHFAYYQFKH